MRKIILLILPIILLSAGCTNKKEQLFSEYGKQYYDKHMKMVNNIDMVTITLADLRNASAEDEYNLKKLEKCEASSKIIFYIDKEKNIENLKIELNC